MRRIHRFLALSPLLAMCAGAAACGGERVPPKALSDARADLVRAEEAGATKLDPVAVHQAQVDLARAEQAWRDHADDPSVADLALVADREALIARANAGTILARQRAQQARAELEASGQERLRDAQTQIGQMRQQLGAAEMQLQQQEGTTVAQAQKLQALQLGLDDARRTISRFASVKDDDRGMVVTLQGETLFQTGMYDLKPTAMARLDEIAHALQGKEARIVVYGYTDDVGPRDANVALSENRAQAVRDYLVSKGIAQDLVTAEGKGPEDPVAGNGSADGRAQNRRVEIVVRPKNQKP
jgi:outer membrane protein OmpA-like peptidoglycan-associated protein